MAKKAKKTAARRKSSRKPAKRVQKIIRGTATLGVRAMPVFEKLDPVRILNSGTVGVVVSVVDHYRGEPDYGVRFRNGEGSISTKYFVPGDLEHA